MQCEYQTEGSAQDCQVGTVSRAWDPDQLQAQSKWRALVDRVACGLSSRGQVRGDGETRGDFRKWEVPRVSCGSHAGPERL